jgi:hypothetical protein
VPNLALIALGDSHHSQGGMKFATQISPLLNYYPKCWVWAQNLPVNLKILLTGLLKPINYGENSVVENIGPWAQNIVKRGSRLFLHFLQERRIITTGYWPNITFFVAQCSPKFLYWIPISFQYFLPNGFMTKCRFIMSFSLAFRKRETRNSKITIHINDKYLRYFLFRQIRYPLIIKNKMFFNCGP